MNGFGVGNCMEDWVMLEESESNAKNEKDKRRLFSALSKKIGKASIQELEDILDNTNSKLVKEQVKLELWWRSFCKDPENLHKFVKTATDEDQISRAIAELGEVKYRKAISTIIKFLDHVNLRDSAALALREMPTQDALVPLINSIKNNPDGSECLLYSLEVLDCSDIVEFLVDFYISRPKAILVREDICSCFSGNAIKKIQVNKKNTCCDKLSDAIKNADDRENVECLNRLLSIIMETEVFW
jgi:hypothetical protein